MAEKIKSNKITRRRFGGAETEFLVFQLASKSLAHRRLGADDPLLQLIPLFEFPLLFLQFRQSVLQNAVLRFEGLFQLGQALDAMHLSDGHFEIGFQFQDVLVAQHRPDGQQKRAN